MTATAFNRGHPIHAEIVWDKSGENMTTGEWVYDDTGEPIKGNERPCANCGRMPSPKGHDACLGTLPGVKAACCGHGGRDKKYTFLEGDVE